MRDWEPSNNVKDVRSFLGFANYYRRFVPAYAGIASALMLLMKKNIEWHWGPVQRRAFSELNSALCNTPLLVFLDPKLPYIVVTDASADAAGGVLMQNQGDGLRPVAFMSRALKPTEQRYSAYRRELATVAYCCIQWRNYLEGCLGKVTAVTNHQPLIHLMEQQVLSRTQSRWVRLGLLQSINPKFRYHLGKANIVADALSRSRPHWTEDKNIDHPAQRGADEDLAGVMTVQASSAQLSTADLQHIEEVQKTDEELQEKFSQSEEQLQKKNFRISPQEILYHVEGDQWLMVVPKVLQQKIIQENHDVPTIEHVGLNRIVHHIKRAFWWRGIWSTVGEYVRSCPVCQLVKSDHKKKAGALQPIPLPERKWQ